MKSFKERNPLPIALVGIVVIAAMLYVGLNAANISLFGRKDTYRAEFQEAAGITSDNEVRIAGVRVGQVKDVRLAGDQVEVTFTVAHGTVVPDQSKANIKLKTLLGTKYLEIVPAGSGTLSSPIPMTRTTVPFQIYDAFTGLTDQLDQIDTSQLAQSLEVISQTFSDPQNNLSSALTGLTKLSETLSSRDQQIAQLLDRTKQLTQLLDSTDQQLLTLLGQADVVLKTVQQRKAIIDKLLADTADLSAQLTRLVVDNRTQLNQAVSNLQPVLVTLQNASASLEHAITLLGPLGRATANVNGNAEWLDIYTQNLLLPASIAQAGS